MKSGDNDSVALQRLYDGHGDYVARRDADSPEARQILLEVREFKIPNLVSLLPAGFEYTLVVEIGCATGELIGEFPPPNSTRNIRRVGFDISALNVRAAKYRYPDVEFHVGEFSSWRERADIVVLSDVLEHVPDDVDLLARAAATARVTLINLPLEDNVLNATRTYGMNDPSGHLRKYSLADGFTLVAAAGLEVINWRRIWVHETEFESHRRQLRRHALGSAFSGPLPLRAVKASVFAAARHIRPFGRWLFPSNLFVCAERPARK